MRRILGFFVFFLFAAAVAGCQVISTRPLLDSTDAELAFGDKFLAIFYTEETGFIDKTGSFGALTGTANGNGYDITDGNDGKAGESASLRLHPASGLPFDYLAEMISAERTTYVAVRRTATGFAALNIELSESVLKTLAERGIQPVKDGMNSRVESRGALDEVIRAWSEQIRAAGDSAKFPILFEIASTDAAISALMARALDDVCLAKAGHPFDPAVKKMRGKYAFGVQIDRIDVESARKACSRGSEPNASDSVRYALGRVFVQAKEYDKLPDLMAPLIARDRPFANLMQFDRLSRGLGMPADVEAGRQLLFEKASHQPLLAYYAAVMLAGGHFGATDFVRAKDMYEEAIGAGIVAAKTGLGLLYASGSGVTKDEARAFSLFKEAAAGKDLRGTVETGRALYIGAGVKQNFQAAYGYLKIAAEAGDPEAQFFAGYMTARGHGVAKSESEAIKLLSSANQAGHLTAKAELGRMIHNGEGQTADRAKGRKLMEEAANGGSRLGKEYLASLENPSEPQLPKNAPNEVQADVETLGSDRPFKLNRVNMPFMGGLAQHLAKACGLPSDLEDRMELAGLAINGTTGLFGGTDYSNPDIGKAVGSMMGATAMFAAGVKFGEQIPCNSGLAGHFADRLVTASRSNKGGNDSPFIPSCARTFDETRCACLAQLGRGVMPDIYQRTYDRAIIKEIIGRNPFLGLGVGLTCQIVNY